MWMSIQGLFQSFADSELADQGASIAYLDGVTNGRRLALIR